MSSFTRGFIVGAAVVLAVDLALQVRKQVRKLDAEDARFSSLSAEDREWMNSPTGPLQRLTLEGPRSGEKGTTCRGCEDGTCNGEYGSAPWMS